VMRAAMPSPLGSLFPGKEKDDPAALRAAIEVAKEVGVSLVEIRDAEEALARMQGNGKGR